MRLHVQPPRARGARGFTLLELLVVVLLIGLLTTFAVLGIRGRSPQELQKREAQRLLARMQLAHEEAVVRAHSLGIRFGDHGYHFLTLGPEGQQWRPVADDDQLKARKLPDDMHFEVDIDGLDVSLTRPKDKKHQQNGNDDDGSAERPQVFFLSSGEIMPGFTIHLLADATTEEYRVQPGEERWLTLVEKPL